MKGEAKNKSLTQSVWSRIGQQQLFRLFLLSVLCRVVVAFAMGEAVVELPGVFDQISYHNLALRVLGGYGFSFGQLWWPNTAANAPTSHWSFLYTLYLVAVYAVFGPHPLVARILQAIIVGILHPYIAFRIGERIFGKTVGLVTAGITALYLYYIYYDAVLMTEPFYITGILFILFFSIKLADSDSKKEDTKLGIALGISIGITVLLRQVFLLFIPFLFFWIWIARFKRSHSLSLRTSPSLPIVSTALAFLLIALFILPVSLYNQSRFGRFVLLNTNSGYAFFWGNHPIYGTNFIPILPAGTYQELIPEAVRHLDEAALDQELLGRGIRFVIEDPRRYVLLSLSRIPAYFTFWPSRESSVISNISRVSSFGLMLPFMLYGLILGIRRRFHQNGNRFLNLLVSAEGLLMLFAVIYSGVHLLTWALIRYRLPVDAVLIPFAGFALFSIAEKILKLNPERDRTVENS
jgi:Dolichyl-phosphate-mannose-protein mannosyltransferase